MAFVATFPEICTDLIVLDGDGLNRMLSKTATANIFTKISLI